MQTKYLNSGITLCDYLDYLLDDDMKIASHKTINSSKKTSRRYAYNAIERATLERDGEDQEKADKAMTQFFAGEMPKSVMIEWAVDEIDYRKMHE